MKIKIHRYFFITWLIVLALLLFSDNKSPMIFSEMGYSNIYQPSELLRFIFDFEKVINKNDPNLTDYYSLFGLHNRYGRSEEFYEIKWCKDKLKVSENSNKCQKFISQRHSNPSESPSFRLIEIKKTLGADKEKVRLFIEVSFKPCQKPKEVKNLGDVKLGKNVIGTTIISGLACDRKLNCKKIILELPCNDNVLKNFGKIVSININGEEY